MTSKGAIITLENLEVPLKMSLSSSHLKLPISPRHEWVGLDNAVMKC